ncbi:hypothetical protein A2801_00905 [Candidatus Woesebacteria bacterium RIFCSPHIGHO2_01_FULL_41_10]|uniref:Uncharacterized protein n=1 Tax=Candidatus Woesebacteria bacterium RIFCSPHIGHO2_01_FULL_41_10 TaxID=1802500 RepID=A0A1F7YMC3_9BACT|nr:MAG: hypothetical protein A2801_00905 [Candidatus Woesebacteria bacterium RIFCSPHIGHO2_01_FULL_41_10]
MESDDALSPGCAGCLLLLVLVPILCCVIQPSFVLGLPEEIGKHFPGTITRVSYFEEEMVWVQLEECQEDPQTGICDPMNNSGYHWELSHPMGTTVTIVSDFLGITYTKTIYHTHGYSVGDIWPAE